MCGALERTNERSKFSTQKEGKKNRFLSLVLTPGERCNLVLLSIKTFDFQKTIWNTITSVIFYTGIIGILDSLLYKKIL
jgi:hypothetical protein